MQIFPVSVNIDYGMTSKGLHKHLQFVLIISVSLIPNAPMFPLLAEVVRILLFSRNTPHRTATESCSLTEGMLSHLDASQCCFSHPHCFGHMLAQLTMADSASCPQ